MQRMSLSLSPNSNKENDDKQCCIVNKIDLNSTHPPSLTNNSRQHSSDLNNNKLQSPPSHSNIVVESSNLTSESKSRFKFKMLLTANGSPPSADAENAENQPDAVVLAHAPEEPEPIPSTSSGVVMRLNKKLPNPLDGNISSFPHLFYAHFSN